MTNEEINTAIAEATGWILTAMNWWYKDGEYFALPPDFCNDLNAMHEAEKFLDDEQWLEYMLNLQDVLGHNPDRSRWTVCRENMSATARQRAEAFLKTLNLWKQ